jgi:hypothetical protein
VYRADEQQLLHKKQLLHRQYPLYGGNSQKWFHNPSNVQQVDSPDSHRPAQNSEDNRQDGTASASLPSRLSFTE